MISSIFDTIASSIDNVGGLLGWIFIGAVIIYGLRGNNGNSKGSSRKNNGGTAS